MKKAHRLISILLVVVLLFSFSSCQTTFNSDEIDSVSVMKDAEIIGDLKGVVGTEGTFIQVSFPEKTTFDTVVIKEKGNQVFKFSIWIEDKNGEFVPIYQQDRIGEYRYCEICEHTAKTLKICIDSANESQYHLKSIDVLNVNNNKKDNFRVT